MQRTNSTKSSFFVRKTGYFAAIAYTIAVPALFSISTTNTSMSNSVSMPENSHATSAISPQQSESAPVTFFPDDPKENTYSAAWWQTTARFLECDPGPISNLESASFLPIREAGRGYEDVRMTTDWLDFAVEHLSKWWKALDDAGRGYSVGKLQAYVQQQTVALRARAKSQGSISNGIMNTTLAVVPIGVPDKTPILTKTLSQTALMATVVSLLRQGIGRIVLVGAFDADREIARRSMEAIQIHAQVAVDHNNSEHVFQSDSAVTDGFEIKIGFSELAYVHVASGEDSATKDAFINVPRLALVGLQQALRGDEDVSAVEWIGSRNTERNFEYKYIYFTEPDQVVNARLTSDFVEVMDQGGVILPHRLQLVPHWFDVEGTRINEKGPSYVLRELAPTIYSLDADQGDGCCDMSSSSKLPVKPTCGSHWWQCGVKDEGRLFSENGYQFMQLLQGTGIVHLAASNQSRRCKPTKNIAPGGCSAQ